jgi:hypothetical protein
MAILAVLSPGNLQKIAHIPIVPIEKPASPDGPKEVVMVPPRECSLGGSQYPEEHIYHRIFTFVEFGEDANAFLKACGVKDKLGCSDIVNVLTTDPRGFLDKTNAGGDEGPEKYVNPLSI